MLGSLIVSVMYWMFLLITLPAIVGCGYLYIRLTEAREALEKESDRTRPQGYCLQITLRDPLAVARSESMLGRLGSRFAPRLITKEVYRKLQEAVAEQLIERRIAADFELLATSATVNQEKSSRRSARTKSSPTRPRASETAELEVSGIVVDTGESKVVRTENTLALEQNSRSPEKPCKQFRKQFGRRQVPRENLER